MHRKIWYLTTEWSEIKSKTLTSSSLGTSTVILKSPEIENGQSVDDIKPKDDLNAFRKKSLYGPGGQ